MKKTALYDKHLKLGAKIVDFAGWLMPVMYSSIKEEHHATREGVGIFDVSHMGEFIVKGKNSIEFLKKVLPTKLSKLEKNKSMYSMLCNEKGGVIDDLFVYMISDEEYYLVVNAGTIEKDFKWLNDHLIEDVELIDVSASTSKIDLQGPLSEKILSKVIIDKRISALERFYFAYFDYKGTRIMIAKSGYTGEAGFEIYIDNSLAGEIWDELIEAGKDYGIKPVGLGARDTLRLECSYSLYGHELSDEISPIEAGLKWVISSDDDFVGKNILDEQINSGTKIKLIAFELDNRGVPREGYVIVRDDKEIGKITSGSFSPTFNKGIGLGLVESGSVKVGDKIGISIRNKIVSATVVKKPFYTFNG